MRIKMRIIFCFLLMSSFINIVWAESSKKDKYAQVVLLIGEGTSEKNKLKLHDWIDRKAILSTGPASYLKIYIPSEFVTILLGPYTKVILGGYSSGMSNYVSTHTVENGMCRVVASNKRGGRVPFLSIEGVSATVGLAVGDIIFTTTKAFNESELIVMSKDATFNAKVGSEEDRVGVVVKQGEWLGIGGRFGEKIRDKMKLSIQLYSHYNYFGELASSNPSSLNLK